MNAISKRVLSSRLFPLSGLPSVAKSKRNFSTLATLLDRCGAPLGGGARRRRCAQDAACPGKPGQVFFLMRDPAPPAPPPAPAPAPLAAPGRGGRGAPAPPAPPRPRGASIDPPRVPVGGL